MGDNRKYYVLCAANCKFEGMTKEQILTAITQAVETGEIIDVDTGFVTKIKEQNHNSSLSFWLGTSAEYNALAEKAEDCFYIITDDTAAADFGRALEEVRETAANITAASSALQKDIAAENAALRENIEASNAALQSNIAAETVVLREDIATRLDWVTLADENASGQKDPTIQLSAPLTDYTEVVILANVGGGANSAYKNTPIVYVGEEAEKQIGNFEETVANSGKFHAFKTPIVKLTNTETLIGEQIISSSVNTAKIKVETTFYSNARIIVVAR